MRPEDQNYNSLDIHESRLAKGLGAQHRNGHFQRLQIVDPQVFPIFLAKCSVGLPARAAIMLKSSEAICRTHRSKSNVDFSQPDFSNVENRILICDGVVSKNQGPSNYHLGAKIHDKPLGEILR